MTYPFWPIAYPYWPTMYLYWPDPYLYWPVHLAGMITLTLETRGLGMTLDARSTSVTLPTLTLEDRKMAVSREVKESPLRQGVDEQIAYKLTTTPWGSTPSAVAVVAYDITTSTWALVTSTVLSGSASVSGDVITTPIVKSLTANYVYRIEVKFTCSGNIFEAFFILNAEN